MGLASATVRSRFLFRMPVNAAEVLDSRRLSNRDLNRNAPNCPQGPAGEYPSDGLPAETDRDAINRACRLAIRDQVKRIEDSLEPDNWVFAARRLWRRWLSVKTSLNKRLAIAAGGACIMDSA